MNRILVWLRLSKWQLALLFVCAVGGFVVGWLVPRRERPMTGQPVELVPVGEGFVPIVE